MKQTVYLLKNDSYSLGIYRIGDEEFTLPPRSSVRVTTQPNSMTASIVVRSFVEDIPDVKTSKSAPKAEEDKGE